VRRSFFGVDEIVGGMWLAAIVPDFGNLRPAEVNVAQK
jgi:hypothetical protein